MSNRLAEPRSGQVIEHAPEHFIGRQDQRAFVTCTATLLVLALGAARAGRVALGGRQLARAEVILGNRGGVPQLVRESYRHALGSALDFGRRATLFVDDQCGQRSQGLAQVGDRRRDVVGRDDDADSALEGAIHDCLKVGISEHGLLHRWHRRFGVAVHGFI